jgi:uncharacterized protein
MSTTSPLLTAFAGPQRKSSLILLGSTVLMLVWRYYATPEALVPRFAGPYGDGRAAAAAVSFAACFLLLGVLPALVVRFVFRERLADYGLGLGLPRRTWWSFVLAAPFFVAAGYVASRDATILEKFPINPHANASTAAFALHAATYLLFYAGWEFHFRGFLLHGLRPVIGDANAVLVQTMASSLLHIGSPASETFGAILGGLFWGALALRTRSLLPSLGQHFLLGIALDAFIFRGRAG